VESVLRLLRIVDWSARLAIDSDVSVTFYPAGHLLGAASVLLESATSRVLFSGDLGRADDLLMRPPALPRPADWVVIESTYGDRRHASIDPESDLVTRIYREHIGEHRLTAAECEVMCSAARFVNSVEESKRLSALGGPMIVISASGMASGGRVLHHLRAFAPDPRNMIVFVGYQAAGTRGAVLVSGAETVKVHGEWIRVRAEVVQLQSMSAHADREQLIAWMQSATHRPERIFVTHGEPAAADALRQYLMRATGAEVIVPEHGESFTCEARPPE
jgi:metallo-beta-lactamase family protein